MKKLVILLPVLFLLAAGCDTNTKTSETNDPSAAMSASSDSSKQTNSKADAVVNDLISDISAEESASTQSDTSIVSSDSEVIINSAEGVSNAN